MAGVPTTEYVVTAAVVVGTAVGVGLLGHGSLDPTATSRGAGRHRGRGRRAGPHRPHAGGLPGGAGGRRRHAAPARRQHLARWPGGPRAHAPRPRRAGRGRRAGAGPVLGRRGRRPRRAGGGGLRPRVADHRLLGRAGQHRLRPPPAGQGGAGPGRRRVAAWNRYRLLPALRASTRHRTRRAGADLLVRSLGAEAAVLAVALAVTGFLVDRSPQVEASAVDRAREGVQTATLDDVELQARLAPLTAGPNAVTIELRDAAGAPFEGFDAPRARLASDQVDLGTVPLTTRAPAVHRRGRAPVRRAPGASRSRCGRASSTTR